MDERAEQVLIAGLSKLDFNIVILDGEKITDEAGFFKEIASALRFPDYFGNNWDAFGDSFGDVFYRPEKRLAIIWKRASVTLRANLYVFLKAAHELLTAARGSVKDRVLESEPVQFEIFFLGEPPNFVKRP